MRVACPAPGVRIGPLANAPTLRFAVRLVGDEVFGGSGSSCWEDDEEFSCVPG